MKVQHLNFSFESLPIILTVSNIFQHFLKSFQHSISHLPIFIFPVPIRKPLKYIKKKKKKKGRSRDQKRNTKYEGALENKFNVKIFGVKFVHESTWNYTKARSMKRR